MDHGTTLIATIVTSLLLAFAGGFVATKMRLPTLVGYLVAGVIIGPFTPGIMGDTELTGQLAEIGIILLMFGVGLHFSINDLLAVRKIAIPVAIVQLVVATALGVAVAKAFGWPLGGGLVFGFALSVASTVVALRALEERNTLDSVNGQIAVGALIVQDLIMVLVLVLLPAVVSPDGSQSARNLAISVGITLGEVALFLALVLVVGKRVVPWLLTHVAQSGSRELFTLAVLATALGIAYGSSEMFGVSFALGAFFAGVVLSESDFSHQAAADSLPLKDAFAVLFFVSVGMLFDPSILVREPLAVLATVLIIVIAKSAASFVVLLARGYAVPAAAAVTASLSQIGEFSFILAGLGVSLKVLPAEGNDLILAGALLSITLNPLVFLNMRRFGTWFGARRSVTAWLARTGGDDLSALSTSDEGLKDHAVIVGYGRVGTVIGKGLKAQGFPIVAVEQDLRLVKALRGRGVTSVYGDASTPGVLKAARAEHARIVVIATPVGFQTRRIIELARELKDDIDIAVRTHSEREVAYLEQQGVGIAIMAERELAFGLLDYSLRTLGVTEDKARIVVQNLRVSGEGGAFERRPNEPEREAPELRLRRGRDQG